MNINKLIEGQMEEIAKVVNKYSLNVFRPIPQALEISATQAIEEHTKNTLIKFLDSEIERLEKMLIDIEAEYGDVFYKQPFGQGKYESTKHQITHLQDIKKQLE